MKEKSSGAHLDVMAMIIGQYLKGCAALGRQDVRGSHSMDFWAGDRRLTRCKFHIETLFDATGRTIYKMSNGRAAEQFGATWLVLDANRPEPLAELYSNPESAPHFMVRSAFGPVLVLEITPD